MKKIKDSRYSKLVAENIYRLILFEFPNIKNLKIEATELNTISFSFDEGEYTREEVESKVIEYRNNTRKFKHEKD